jgi:hypothetical protein
MVLAHHIILTGYGHWLPNDPRGSLSADFRSPRLEDLGPIHHGRKPRQPPGREIRSFYRAAVTRLDHPVLWFERDSRNTIGECFGRVISGSALTCYACAILSDHAHVLIRRHRLDAEGMIRLFKEASARALAAGGLAPMGHPVWSSDDFVAFKDSPEAIRAATEYIESNPGKHHLEAQHWSFVVRCDGWPRSFRKRSPPNGKPPP